MFDALDLDGITLVCQDWGGLHRPAPRRRARPTASRASSPPTRSCPTGDAHAGRGVPRVAAVLAGGRRSSPIGRIVNGGCTHRPRRRRGDRRLRRAVPRRDVQGGRAPVPDARADHARRSRGGAEPRRVGGRSSAFDRPFLTAFSDSATRSPPAATASSSERIPGAAGQPHTTIEGGGHFLQEDRGAELAEVVVDLIART